jgi:hypothetical protein
MPDFFPAPDGARIVLDRAETQLLEQLTRDFRQILHGGRVDRGDPIYDRLFPSAYENPKDEAAYRDLTGSDLAKHKSEALERVRSKLGRRGTDVTLDAEEFESWIQCLTDLRLTIGTNLDVDEEKMAAEPDSPELSVLHWLGWLTEGLLEARSR